MRTPGKGCDEVRLSVDYSKGKDDAGKPLRETIVFKNGVRKNDPVAEGDRGRTISGHEYGHARVDRALRKPKPSIARPYWAMMQWSTWAER